MSFHDEAKRVFYEELIKEYKERSDKVFMTKEEVDAAVADAEPENPDDVAPSRPSWKRPCVTQKEGGVNELNVGLYRKYIVLWENESTINWILNKASFDKPQDALDTAAATLAAAKEWNEVMGTRVKFEYVDNVDDACFMVVYNGNSNPDRVLARAFFPEYYFNTLNIVEVFELQLKPAHRATLKATMLHELGHVLGLRHEFAQIEDVEGPTPSYSVEFGSPNKYSIMSYEDVRSIADTDKKYIKKAYDELKSGSTYTGKSARGDLTKTVVRVTPDN